ncbi:MAG: exodeoxyribonuclease VII large subunit [Rhodospirillaceae bacterium]|nr:MAG: exodeoxyribonuclease VII large subunit [Rhodospirillaceae bacterium]
MVPISNLSEYSVTELSFALKRTVEEAFGLVRVRGEISGFKRHSSGHCYLRLKDEQAVLEAVIWKNVAMRLGITPEEGLEVVVSGRITTYPGRSNYQILIDSMAVAGQGALLKLLEERRRRLAAEGLFNEDRKKKLPFLPEVIGVITSPTGAVIRDILHRLNDRFPRRVLLWPVAVQGEGAATQIAAAITGFNQLSPGGKVPRPDVLIVARGGGSLEDLWPFNEEVVVRAAAASVVPLIAAVGHETDTTLIDFAADRRAPTPTAAAEMAVPVRLDLLAQVERYGGRLTAAMARTLKEGAVRVEGLTRGLPDPSRLIEERALRLDDRAERLMQAVRVLVERRAAELARCFSRLPHPREHLAARAHAFERLAGDLRHAMATVLAGRTSQWERLAPRVQAMPLLRTLAREQRDVGLLAERLQGAVHRLGAARADALDRLGRLLENYSYASVLRRGFALVRDEAGHVVESATAAVPATVWTVTFHDGRVPVRVDSSARSRNRDLRQGRLF